MTGGDKVKTGDPSTNRTGLERKRSIHGFCFPPRCFGVAADLFVGNTFVRRFDMGRKEMAGPRFESNVKVVEEDASGETWSLLGEVRWESDFSDPRKEEREGLGKTPNWWWDGNDD